MKDSKLEKDVEALQDANSTYCARIEATEKRSEETESSLNEQITAAKQALRASETEKAVLESSIRQKEDAIQQMRKQISSTVPIEDYESLNQKFKSLKKNKDEDFSH